MVDGPLEYGKRYEEPAFAKKNDYDVSIKEDGIEINNIIPINDFENGENWTKLMNRLKLEIIKMI